MGTDALRLLGFRGYQASRAARTFLRHDEESMREQARLRGDRVALLQAARSRIERLERHLLADLEDAGETRDLGWDVESLREEVRKMAPRS